METLTALHVWNHFLVRSQVWLYRLLCNMKRYEPVALIRRQWLEGEPRLDEFPWPSERLVYFPEKPLSARVAGRLEVLLRGGPLKALSPADAKYVRSLCRERNASVVHLHFGELACAFLGCVSDLGAPMVVTFYGTDVFGIGGRYRQRVGKLLQQNLHFVVTSEELARGIIEFGAPPDRVFVVPVGISLADLPGAEETRRHRAERMTAGTLRLITVGRMVNFKAPHMLPFVARTLVDKGVDFEWTVVGDGQFMPDFISNCDRLGVRDKFIVKGHLHFEEIRDLVWHSDVMVHNAVVMPNGARESLGVSLMEGGSAGLPVVSCRVGGIPEVVTDGETGFLVETLDLDGMAEKIMLLAGDAELRCRMGIAAVDYIRTKFDSERLAQQLEEVYDQVLA